MIADRQFENCLKSILLCRMPEEHGAGKMSASNRTHIGM